MLCDAGVRTSVCVIVRKHSSLSIVASFERRWTSARIRHRPSSPRALNALYVGSRLLLSVVASFERRTSARIRHRPSSPRAFNALYVGSRLLLSVVASFERLCGRRVDFRYIDWLKNFTSLCYYMFHTGEWLWTNFSRNLCCKLFNKYA